MEHYKKIISNILSDEKLQMITAQIVIGQSVLVGYELGLFTLLSKKSMTIDKIAKSLNITIRAAQAIVSSACSLNLIEFKKPFYQLSLIGKRYLNPNNPEYYGQVLDLFIQENEIMNYKTIKNAILTNLSQVDNGKVLFKAKNNVGDSDNFVKAIHQKAFNPAFYWPKKIDLSKFRTFADIGGGSGIHTISACLNNQKLKGIVCDRKNVISFTQKYIKSFKLNNRIKTINFDMWNDNFPDADIYFFGDIFHDWSKDQCLYLTKQSYKFLPKNGLIILHEMLFNNEKTAPFLTSGYNMKMMLWTEGQQFSKYEIKSLLENVGFQKIKILKSLGNWSLIIGVK